MDNLRPMSKPTEVNCDLFFDGNVIENCTKYRQILGSLQYVTLTQLDIALAINRLAQFMAAPKDVH